MALNLDDLTPEEAEEALRLLEARRRQEEADQRVLEKIDRALTEYLEDRGVSVGSQWVKPEKVSCAYPKGWVVEHDGHWWQALDHAVMVEPSLEAGEWRLNDPEPEQPTPPDATECEGQETAP